MDIVEEYKYLFEPRIRKRGRLYFYKGTVEDVCVTGNRITCRVKGRKRYKAGVRFYPDHRPELSCTCPFYQEWNSNCKHLWALFLYIDTMVAEGELDYGAIFGNGRDPSVNGWQSLKKQIERRERPEPGSIDQESGFSIFYFIDRAKSSRKNKFCIDVTERFRKKNGSWGRSRKNRGIVSSGDTVFTSDDRKILTVLKGEETLSAGGIYTSGYTVSEEMYEFVIPLMHATGRLAVSDADGRFSLIRADTSSGWDFSLSMDAEDTGYTLAGIWRIQGKTIRRDSIDLLAGTDGLWMLTGNTILFKKQAPQNAWERIFFDKHRIPVKEADLDDFISFFNSNQHDMPDIAFPQELMFEEVRATDIERLVYVHFSHDQFWAEPAFLYDGEWEFSSSSESVWFMDVRRKKKIRRSRKREIEYERQLEDAGFTRTGRWYHCDPEKIQNVLETAAEAGWVLYGEDRVSRIAVPSSISVRISGGADWFDLEGGASFDRAEISLAHIVDSLRRGSRFLKLDSGELGLLPADWVEKYSDLFSAAVRDKQGFKVKSMHMGLMDDFSEDECVEYDRTYKKLKSSFSAFSGVRASDPPDNFEGELREYQKTGLGWLEFLDRYNFGGCLGDDMGLGKTVQVLAFLEKKRQEKGALFALIVVPASIIFNWLSEAGRFTPHLAVLPFWGTERKRDWKKRSEFSILLTSYATMVRDISFLKDEHFDYVIFDEAQHLKNYHTKRSRAARKLQSGLKLSLTGTPLENHLGDLWSQFALLNPGLLGGFKDFRTKYIRGDNTDTLKKIIYPFILRRTKDEVLTDLPEKVDEVLYCEMEERQRKYYEDVRELFRMKIMKCIDTKGMAGSRMNILEGLLRLRQICCYPGLVDARRTGDSGKLASLKAMVEEIAEEGSKALIFSQFTKMLSVIRTWVNKKNIRHEYLDGKTVNREERIHSFQNDGDIRLFLVSLKAGGVGVNLTAADYVFIYDPWWNPAVENQAIDRAYRIGRTNPVFTYRMITRESIEQKIHALQKEKQGLIHKVIDTRYKTISDLKIKDIEYLFS